MSDAKCTSCGAALKYLRTERGHWMPTNAETVGADDKIFKPGVHVSHFCNVSERRHASKTKGVEDVPSTQRLPTARIFRSQRVVGRCTEEMIAGHPNAACRHTRGRYVLDELFRVGRDLSAHRDLGRRRPQAVLEAFAATELRLGSARAFQSAQLRWRAR